MPVIGRQAGCIIVSAAIACCQALWRNNEWQKRSVWLNRPGFRDFSKGQAKEGAISAGFNQIPFPQQKGEIELMAARGLIASMDRELAKRGEKFMLSSPHLNPERDFDIAVSTPTGNASLEMR